MGFFKKILKAAKKIAPIAVGFIPGIGPLAAAGIGAGIGAMGGGGIRGALMGGISGYGGSALAGGLRAAGSLPMAGVVGPQAGGISAGLSNLASGVPGAWGALTGGTGLMSNATSALQAAQYLIPQKQAINEQNTWGVAKPEAPLTRPGAIERPTSLSDMANFAPEQERSALATRGINTGLGEDENTYYRNLVQRSLIGEGNQINTENPNFLLPIESQYFSGQGKNTADIVRFLQGIR